MKTALKNVLKLFESEKIRYLFIGGLTTLVNFVCFYVLYNICGCEVTLSNFISICAAIIFAFWSNKYIVFRSEASTGRELLGEFAKFIAGRIAAMGVEIGGVYLLFNIMGIHAMVSKVLVQIIVVIFNYIVSKFFVFRK